MENPELDFLQYLLTRFMAMQDIDPEKCTVKELMDSLLQELTPIGGG